MLTKLSHYTVYVPYILHMHTLQMFVDLPRFSIGDTVSVKSEDKEIQLVLSKNQEAAEYFSMVKLT